LFNLADQNEPIAVRPTELDNKKIDAKKASLFSSESSDEQSLFTSKKLDSSKTIGIIIQLIIKN
jgi:hypothetical protein